MAEEGRQDLTGEKSKKAPIKKPALVNKKGMDDPADQVHADAGTVSLQARQNGSGGAAILAMRGERLPRKSESTVETWP